MKWINVKDRLPDEWGRYYVVIKTPFDSFVDMAIFYPEIEKDTSFNEDRQPAHWECKIDILPAKITHWMPLPNPPKDKP